MNDLEYAQGALRTESPVTPEMIERFHTPESVQYLKYHMERTISSGKRINLLKKFLFYGKQQALGGYMLDSTLRTHEAARRITPENIRLLHAAIGLATESAEILEALHAHIFEGKELDKVNLIEEGGDQFWYLAILADVLRSSFMDMKGRNYRKLRARFGDKFSAEAATTRDLEKEREELEKSEVSEVSEVSNEAGG